MMPTIDDVFKIRGLTLIRDEDYSWNKAANSIAKGASFNRIYTNFRKIFNVFWLFNSSIDKVK